MHINLLIVSPLKRIFQGPVKLVTLPGTGGRFTVLPNHAPILSSLDKGMLRYVTEGDVEEKLSVSGGFVQFSQNNMQVCLFD